MMHPRTVEKIGKVILIVAGTLFILSLIIENKPLSIISVGMVVIPAIVDAIREDVKRQNRRR